MNFAYENGDTSAAYFAGIAQQELMRGCFHQERFLLTNGPGSYDKAVAFLAVTESQLETLYERLYDRDLQEMTTALIGDIEAYLEAAERIRTEVTNRNQLRDGVIDSLGPQIKAELGKLPVAVVERQKTLGPSADQKVSETLLLAALISVGAFLIGSVLAVFVAGRLSSSAQHMADIMAKLAGGNADTNVDGLTTRHELGTDRGKRGGSTRTERSDAESCRPHDLFQRRCGLAPQTINIPTASTRPPCPHPCHRCSG